MTAPGEQSDSVANEPGPARVEPGPGQESVWDYPRPPRIDPSTEHVVVMLGGVTIAETRGALRVLETASPPTYYLPPSDVVDGVLRPVSQTTWCEWKGRATYFDVAVDGRVASQAAWTYRAPHPAFVSIRDYIAFYPGRVDACFVDGERVRAQAGPFYGGWVTSRIVGPFKGNAGTQSW